MTSRNVVEPASAVEPPQTAAPATSGSAGIPGRLAWLDVLRGVAALCVVFDHFGSFVPPRIQATVSQWLDPGTYGVFVFFLISGYIVPASLERKGSVRTFWVSRVFRLYPLYLLAIGIAVALWMTHVGGLRGEDSDAATSVLSQMHSGGGMSAQAELLWERRWVSSFLLAGPTFGTGLALRHVRWLAVLTWLGLISYSVYLLHPALIEVYGHLAWTSHRHSFWPQLLLDASFLAVLLSVCSLTHLFVERPMQTAGRRLARWLDARFGPDRASAPVPVLAHPRAVAE